MTQDTTPKNAGPKPSGNPLWNFSLKIYSSEAVQKACLALQDGSGVDVNVLLYMLWLGARGRRLSAQDMSAVLGAVDVWRSEVVVPLRTARRNLKATPPAFDAATAEALRTMVKKVELEAERLQQTALNGWRPVDSLGQQDEPRAAAASNVAQYGKALGRELAAEPVGVMLAATGALIDQGLEI